MQKCNLHLRLLIFLCNSPVLASEEVASSGQNAWDDLMLAVISHNIGDNFSMLLEHWLHLPVNLTELNKCDDTTINSDYLP